MWDTNKFHTIIFLLNNLKFLVDHNYNFLRNSTNFEQGFVFFIVNAIRKANNVDHNLFKQPSIHAESSHIYHWGSHKISRIVNYFPFHNSLILYLSNRKPLVLLRQQWENLSDHNELPVEIMSAFATKVVMLSWIPRCRHNATLYQPHTISSWWTKFVNRFESRR